MTPAPVTWTATDAAEWITAPRDDDDKYSRGVLGLTTGSAEYPGAAVIGVEAAVHAGIGMVRYDGPDEVGRLVLARRPEVVLGRGRSQAWVIGSGMTSQHAARAVESASAAEGDALVLDAGAIGAVPTGLGPTIVTPHAGELAGLLGRRRDDVLADPVGAALAGARRLGAVVLLKGATTHVVHGDRVVAVREATPWLATAGAGDALAGILGALVAARAARGPLGADDLLAIGATAAFLHGRAARLAAGTGPDGSGGAPFAVLELCARVPDAIRELLG